MQKSCFIPNAMEISKSTGWTPMVTTKYGSHSMKQLIDGLLGLPTDNKLRSIVTGMGTLKYM